MQHLKQYIYIYVKNKDKRRKCGLRNKLIFAGEGISQVPQVKGDKDYFITSHQCFSNFPLFEPSFLSIRCSCSLVALSV